MTGRGSLANFTHRQAYDSHCNLVLGDVDETIYLTEEDDEEDNSQEVRVRAVLLPVMTLCLALLIFDIPAMQTVSRKSEMLFVRGML